MNVIGGLGSTRIHCDHHTGRCPCAARTWCSRPAAMPCLSCKHSSSLLVIILLRQLRIQRIVTDTSSTSPRVPSFSPSLRSAGANRQPVQDATGPAPCSHPSSSHVWRRLAVSLNGLALSGLAHVLSKRPWGQSSRAAVARACWYFIHDGPQAARAYTHPTSV